MKKRGLVIGLLIMLALVTSGFTYAFWAEAVNLGTKEAVGSINIGEGESVTVDVTVGAQGGSTLLLVPTGYVVDADTQTAELTISFEVTWADDDRLDGIANAAVSVLIENIKVNGVANPYTLISVVEAGTNPTEIALGASVTFDFVITMGLPGNQTEYDAVAGLPVTFDLTFEIDPA